MDEGRSVQALRRRGSPLVRAPRSGRGQLRKPWGALDTCANPRRPATCGETGVDSVRGRSRTSCTCSTPSARCSHAAQRGRRWASAASTTAVSTIARGRMLPGRTSSVARSQTAYEYGDHGEPSLRDRATGGTLRLPATPQKRARTDRFAEDRIGEFVGVAHRNEASVVHEPTLGRGSSTSVSAATSRRTNSRMPARSSRGRLRHTAD
jgi:hypothetical protein